MIFGIIGMIISLIRLITLCVACSESENSDCTCCCRKEVDLEQGQMEGAETETESLIENEA